MGLFDGQNSGPAKFDPRIASAAILALVSAALVGVGDQIAFVRPPNNFFEQATGVLPVLMYSWLGDRQSANVASFAIYVVILLAIGLAIYNHLEEKVFKPRQIKQMLHDKRLEERLVNDSEDEESRK